MKFTKAQTNGNDFIIFDGKSTYVDTTSIKRISNRRGGIGCDQVIFIEKNKDNQYIVEFFNQDGSRANMCGNGACATAKYIKDFLREKECDKIELLISKTIYQASLNGDEVTVTFPKPKIIGENMVSTGNKHLILPIEDIESSDELTKRHADCNLHFIEYIDKKSIRLKTFEKGVGWTMACGSGAVAVAFLSGLQGKVRIVHDGGISTVEVLDNSVTLTTAPQLVFEGVMYGEA